MLHSHASLRSSSPWFLMVLALLAALAALAAPSYGGVTLSLAAVFLAGVAGFAAGNGEHTRAAYSLVAEGNLTARTARDAAVLERAYKAFDETATLRLDGAIARLRVPLALQAAG